MGYPISAGQGKPMGRYGNGPTNFEGLCVYQIAAIMEYHVAVL